MSSRTPYSDFVAVSSSPELNFVTVPNLDGGPSSLTHNTQTSVVSYKLPIAKVYASASLTNDVVVTIGSGNIHIIGSGTGGFTAQLSNATPTVLHQGVGVTYPGFKAPRAGIYNVSISSEILASQLGGLQIHTKLRSGTTNTILVQNRFFANTSNIAAYTVTNSAVVQMAANDIIYFEAITPNGQSNTIRGDNSSDNDTRINFFSVD